MSSVATSPWRLVREIGLDYAKHAAMEDPIVLRGPICAERTQAGGHLVVDEDPPNRGMLCRTLLLTADHEVAYDSRAQGVDDAYGCLMDGRQFAMLQRARSELCVLSISGEPVRSIDLSRISKLRPRILSWTQHGTFLIAFLAGPRKLDIVELDRRGSVLWSRIDSVSTIGIPASLQLLPNDSILIADEFHHVVWQLGRDGSSILRWGDWHSPSSSLGHLHRPRAAHQLANGTLLIADTNNSRILVVERSGRTAPLQPKSRALFSPSSVRRLPNGNYLICDAGSRCVFELDSRGETLPRHGSLKVRKRAFSFPRSIQYSGGGRYLIANTAQNTIVEVSNQRMRELPVRRNPGLFWPRSARKTKSGTVIVADGRNSRIVELSPRGVELRQLKQSRHKDVYLTLQDPHDVRLQPNGNLLVVDSPQGLVFETDWNGQTAWVIGLESDNALRDPHSAQLLPDGQILIADTHNNRILFVDPRTHKFRSISEIRSGNVRCELRLPRYAEAMPDGTLVIADTGNNRVLITDIGLRSLEILSTVPDSPLPHFGFPRWIQPVSRDELIISDHGNHRIVHLRRRIGPE